MPKKIIGVVGGAGPLAGLYMIERMIKYAQKNYNCYRDEDFPSIILLSYPFSDMLSVDVDNAKVSAELSGCINKLKSDGACQIVIACNTLHAFLQKEVDITNMMSVLGQNLSESQISNPVVLCSGASARYQIHQQYFDCEYPDQMMQNRVDELIERVLHGECKEEMAAMLQGIIRQIANEVIILGCTELSLLADAINISHKKIIDSTETIAALTINNYFSTRV
jgi:aspartate racemase